MTDFEITLTVQLRESDSIDIDEIVAKNELEEGLQYVFANTKNYIVDSRIENVNQLEEEVLDG